MSNIPSGEQSIVCHSRECGQRHVTARTTTPTFIKRTEEYMSIVTIPSRPLPHPPAVYSQGVRVANLLFVAGQTGVDFSTGKLADEFELQARQAFENVSTVLQAYGSSLENVVKTTVWLRDATSFDSMNKLYAEYFPRNAPTRSTPIVALPKPNLQISIEAIAVMGNSARD
jgi:2-iminobutanoate/2-iminopropanoate deaminase